MKQQPYNHLHKVLFTTKVIILLKHQDPGIIGGKPILMYKNLSEQFQFLVYFKQKKIANKAVTHRLIQGYPTTGAVTTALVLGVANRLFATPREQAVQIGRPALPCQSHGRSPRHQWRVGKC